MLALLAPFLNHTVGVKLSPSVEFEGVDRAQHWRMARTQRVPAAVLRQMQSPHLVVVRAAHRQMQLREVLDLCAHSSRAHAAKTATGTNTATDITDTDSDSDSDSDSDTDDDTTDTTENDTVDDDNDGDVYVDAAANTGTDTHTRSNTDTDTGTHTDTTGNVNKDDDSDDGDDNYADDSDDDDDDDDDPFTSEGLVNAYVEYFHTRSLHGLVTSVFPQPEHEHEHGNNDNDEEDNAMQRGSCAKPNKNNNSIDFSTNPLPGVLQSVLLQGKAHLWLGDGRTVGKLHFDPFDNILVQLAGAKTFRLTDPGRNERLLEGHMREAELEVRTEMR
jgi:hypothetical protein